MQKKVINYFKIKFVNLHEKKRIMHHS